MGHLIITGPKDSLPDSLTLSEFVDALSECVNFRDFRMDVKLEKMTVTLIDCGSIYHEQLNAIESIFSGPVRAGIYHIGNIPELECKDVKRLEAALRRDESRNQNFSDHLASRDDLRDTIVFLLAKLKGETNDT